MKLNFGKKLVLFIHWLMSLALCGFMVALFISGNVRDLLPSLVAGVDRLVFAIAVLIVYLIFSAGTVGIIFASMRRWQERNFITVSSSGLGRTRIAVAAVEQMIRQAMRNVTGVAEMKTDIVNNEDSIEINANVILESDAHVPTVTANAQRAIRGYIEQNCGVEVSAVIVSVHSMDYDEPAEKRSRKKKTKVAPAPEPTPVATEPVTAPEALEEPAEGFIPESEPAPEPPELPAEEEASEAAEAEAAATEEEEPISLTLTPDLEAPAVEKAPAEEQPAEAEPEAAPVIEEHIDAAPEEPLESVPEEPVAEPAPETAAPKKKKRKKKNLFSRLFGKGGDEEPEEEKAPESVATEEEPSDTITPVEKDEEPADTVMAVEEAEDLSEAGAAEELVAEETFEVTEEPFDAEDTPAEPAEEEAEEALAEPVEEEEAEDTSAEPIEEDAEEAPAEPEPAPEAAEPAAESFSFTDEVFFTDHTPEEEPQEKPE